MSTHEQRGPYFWARDIDDKGRWHCRTDGAPRRPSGEDLASLRRGIGRPAGTVPELWPFYVTVNDERSAQSGEVSDLLAAEHIALSLYGLHQQSKEQPQHVPRVGLGAALRRLRGVESRSAEAVDRRFNAAATSATLDELALHLRSLVRLLRDARTGPDRTGIGLDYTRLVEDLRSWRWAGARGRTMRRWGNDYFGWGNEPVDGSAESTDSAKQGTTQRPEEHR